ncbi:resolvase [Clostridia bacterium]|nr:resolvase [Clostridia bacterium]
MVSLKNMVNESYALEIGRKIHATKQLNIKDGCFVGARPPYGYLKSKEDGHKLVPDPYAGQIVSRMFEMIASGAGVSDVHAWLRDNNVLPPMRYHYTIGYATEKMARGNENWGKTQIYNLLQNRVYTGDMVQGKYRTHSYDEKRLPKSDWVITPDTHEPLVSREMFAQVQKLFGNEKAPRNPKNGENIFLRKIFCGHCGYTMTRSKSGKTQAMYSCGTRQTYGQDACVQVSINEEKLKQILLTLIQKQAAVLVDKLDFTTADDNAEQTELRNVGAELARASGFHKGLYESLVTGDIDEQEYRDMKQSYESKIAALTEREQELREILRERHLKHAVLDKANKQLGAVSLITDLTAPVIDALVEKILVFPDKHIEVRFKFTDEICNNQEGGADNE